jgi:AraC family transcriptional regulator
MRLPPELRAHGAESEETQRVSVDKVAEARSPRGGLAPWHQRLVAAYIEEHLVEPIPLAALAALVGLSRFHFLRAFKQSFGEPPHRYHNIRRVERAKVLLRDETSVTAIGVVLGFSETSSFSATFRKFTGLTPTEYRRMAR